LIVMSETDRQLRASEGVRFVIEIEVRDIERFKAIVAQCVAVSRTEPGTLVYDWYLDEETGRARLYEAYASLEAVRVHSSGPVFTEVGPPLMEVCTFVHMDAFGDVGDMATQPTFWPTTFWGPAFASPAG
jgi:quinol monooxygenase YgiN